MKQSSYCVSSRYFPGNQVNVLQNEYQKIINLASQWYKNFGYNFGAEKGTA